MESSEIRSKFLKFFESRGHKVVPSSSLLTTDPSVLFTTAGMQQFKSYYTNLENAPAQNIVSIQKCLRTSDIDEVGDNSHLTFFEMLGHFSFGDYFKKGTIEWTYELLTKIFKIPAERISATVFEGDDIIPFDKESFEAWSNLLPSTQIRKGPRTDNVWGPAGVEGPCGACNEVYVDDLEIATLVFMEYYCDKNQNLTPLLQKGVDVGWGFERIVKIVQDKDNIFETDLLESIINLAPLEMDLRTKRIIADHSRSIAFLIADSIRPSNKEQGYVLRRLIRRIVTYNFIFKSDLTLMHDIFAKIVEIYGSYYPELNANTIIYEFDHEKEKFEKTLRQGLKELDKLESVNTQSAFRLYESFGLPYEIIKELGKEKAFGLTREGFDEEFKKHQEISRAGVEKKFGSHGIKKGDLTAENSKEIKKIIRLHTATHILFAALKKVLGQDLKQTGADINAERLRFDFAFLRKLTPEELGEVEKITNKAVNDDLPVSWDEMSLEEAINSGAHGVFMHKYPPWVKVYTIGDEKNWLSREICGGPHVKHTGEIGHIKITKEESVSGGNRRIRAVVE